MTQNAWPAWPPNDNEIFESLRRVWQNGDWGKYHSDVADELRTTISTMWQCPHIRLTCSGTMAVEMALRGVGVKPGDEVVLAGYDYPGNLRCIELIGAKPVLADISATVPSIDPASLQAIKSNSIKAVLVSHLYGQLADIASIREICDERGWMLVEDACQVPGGGRQVDGAFQPVGTFADAATLSFGGSKPLTAGSGGAVLTRHNAVASRISAFAERPSDTLALSPLQCAALLPQFSTLDSLNTKRVATVNRLAELDWSVWGASLVDQTERSVSKAFYKLAIRVADSGDRERLRKRFAELGIALGDGFRSSDRMSPRRVEKPVRLECSAAFAKEVVLLDHRFLLSDQIIERLIRQ